MITSNLPAKKQGTLAKMERPCLIVVSCPLLHFRVGSGEGAMSVDSVLHYLLAIMQAT